MKVDVRHKKIPPPKALNYPVLMQWVSTNGLPPQVPWRVVLFTGPTTGLPLNTDGFGKSEKGWQPATSKCWTPFEGTITFTK